MLQNKCKTFLLCLALPVLTNPLIVPDIDHCIPTELIITVTGSRNKGKKANAFTKQRGVSMYSGVVDPCCALGSLDND